MSIETSDADGHVTPCSDVLSPGAVIGVHGRRYRVDFPAYQPRLSPQLSVARVPRSGVSSSSSSTSRRRPFAALYRIGAAEAPSQVDAPLAETLDGTVPAEAVDELRQALRGAFPAPRSTIAQMSASSWSAVESTYVGLRR